MGGVEFNLGTLNLGQGLGTEEVWASHEDVQRQDEDMLVLKETRVAEVEFFTDAFTCHETRVVESIEVEETRVVTQEANTGVGYAKQDAEQTTRCDAIVKSPEGVTDQNTGCDAIVKSPEGVTDQNTECDAIVKSPEGDTDQITGCEATLRSPEGDTDQISECEAIVKSPEGRS